MTEPLVVPAHQIDRTSRVGGNLVFVRVTYRNSFGDNATLELVSTSFE